MVVPMAFALSACGGNGGNGGGNGNGGGGNGETTQETLGGRFELVRSYSYWRGERVAGPFFPTQEVDYTFSADGTWIANEVYGLVFQGNYTITGNIIMLNAITATGLPGHTIHGTLNADRTEIRMTGYVPFEHDSVIEIFVVKLVQN